MVFDVCVVVERIAVLAAGRVVVSPVSRAGWLLATLAARERQLSLTGEYVWLEKDGLRTAVCSSTCLVDGGGVLGVS